MKPVIYPYPKINRKLIDEFRVIIGTATSIIKCKKALQMTNGNFDGAFDYIKIQHPMIDKYIGYNLKPIVTYKITIEWENNPECTRTKTITTEYKDIDCATGKCLIDYKHENISKIEWELT